MEQQAAIVPVIQDPSLLLALLMTLALLVPHVSERLRIPGIVGLIGAGMAFGPYGFNWISPNPAGLVAMLGHAGLLYILFQSGLETDLHQFLRARRKSFAFGALTFLIPQVGGTLLGRYALGMGWPAAVLFGSMYASHTLLTYPTVSRLGLAKYEPVAVAVGGTVVTNLAALLVLAGVAQHKSGDTGLAFWAQLVLAAGVMGLVIFRFVAKLARWYFRNVPDHGGSSFLMVMGLMFACAWGTQAAGLEAIIGAFAVGLAFNRLIPEQSTLMSRLRFVGDTLFIPMFLLYVGMLANVWALAGTEVNNWLASLGFEPSARALASGAFDTGKTWTAALLMGGGIIALKYLPAWLGARLLGYSRHDANLIFGLTVVQAAATLAAVLVGVRLGLFDDQILDGTIFMILVSCIAGAWATERFGQRLAAHRLAAAEVSSEPPPRLLVPLANPATMPLLMDMALLLRNPARQGRIFPLMVAQPDRGDQGRSVAVCEEMLQRAVAHAAESEAPAVPLVRVDVNVVDGILRAVTEIGATAAMIGWVSQPTAKNFFLGDLFGQMVESCPCRLYVARMARPLQLSKRLLWLVSPHADASPDFLPAARTAKRLAGQAGVAAIEVVISNDSDPGLAGRLDKLEPKLPLTCHGKSSADAMHRTFWTLAKPDDLLVISNARHTGAPDHGLYDLPRAVAEHFPDHTLLVTYAAITADVDPGSQPAYSQRW